MTAAPYFHVGFLVEDLDQAMPRFSSAFGVTWAKPIDDAVTMCEADHGTSQIAPRIVYSREGPPYIELIEATGAGIYAASRGEGVHHVGVWQHDPERRQAELHEIGLDAIATQLTPDEQIVVSYFDPERLHGVMLEIVDEGRRPRMERWFEGGAYDDG